MGLESKTQKKFESFGSEKILGSKKLKNSFSVSNFLRPKTSNMGRFVNRKTCIFTSRALFLDELKLFHFEIDIILFLFKVLSKYAILFGSIT
jgi:hypothetical protein